MLSNPAQIKKQLKPAVMRCLALQAKSELLSEQINPRNQAILAKFKIVDEAGQIITDDKKIYLAADGQEDLVNQFFAACDEANKADGFNLEPGYCPALIAANEHMEAVRDLVNQAAPIFGLTFDRLICSGMDNYNEFVRLTIGMVLAKN